MAISPNNRKENIKKLEALAQEVLSLKNNTDKDGQLLLNFAGVLKQGKHLRLIP